MKRASLFSRQALPFGGIESPFLMSDFLNLFHFEIFNQILFFLLKMSKNKFECSFLNLFLLFVVGNSGILSVQAYLMDFELNQNE